MTRPPRLRNITVTRGELLSVCHAGNVLHAAAKADFERVCLRLDEHYLREFRHLREQFRAAYASLDPDARHLPPLPAAGGQLAAVVEGLLRRANYGEISRRELLRALERDSPFPVRVTVDLNDFEEVILYYRGSRNREVEKRGWFGLARRTVRFTSYDRVVLFLRFREEAGCGDRRAGRRPGSVMLKLFQQVPENDLEMLFPDTRVGMRLRDKLLIGIPAVISGVSLFTTKVGTTLALLASLAGGWLGLHEEQVSLDRTTAVAVLASVGAVVAYLWRQFSKFRNRRLKFSQALTEKLYYSLLDNNAGVLYRILDEAEEEEYKESLLACFFLLAAGAPSTAAELDLALEEWFTRHWRRPIDFDAADALEKLRRLGLADRDGDRWRPGPGLAAAQGPVSAGQAAVNPLPG